jgi:hypothetical protein
MSVFWRAYLAWNRNNRRVAAIGTAVVAHLWK